ncbi:hypothetical protein P7F88_08085 [Vibrio hannami]|uniref:hypothetical protein n=1 Tax=Vibrio hannami TaxID=2717094 RepID=UPI002410B1B6|nr:hypothetical protein [Vibrio hannami]MDG3086056.1 hypothetical protein [Vibrio hannami]
MLIRTKLVAIGCFLFVALIGISIGAMLSFNQLSASFEQVVQGAIENADSAKLATQGASNGSQKAASINADMLAIVDGIKSSNQRTKLISKKVDEISDTLEELIETIEELSEDVADEEALAILEEVSDEVSDISESLKREALVNIIESSKTLNSFSDQIASKAAEVAELNTLLKSQVDISQSSQANSEQIQDQAHQSSQGRSLAGTVHCYGSGINGNLWPASYLCHR